MQMILTPKNIYRVLSGRLMGDIDFLPADQKRGLIQFYRVALGGAVSPETVRRLFPEDGPRPRVQSDLMNRSSSASLPKFLREELERASIVPAVSRNLAGLLGGLVYQVETLMNTLSAFEDVCFQQDFFITPQIKEFLTSLRRLPPDNGYNRLIFLCAYRVAWLILFSFYGAQMNDPVLARQCFEADPNKAWEEMRGASSARWQICSASSLVMGRPLPVSTRYSAKSPRPMQQSS